MTIDDFIGELSKYKTNETVFNMYYGDSKNAIKCRERLKEYLEKHKNAKILLVGEAPGYNGCAKTGVPFESDTGERSAKIINEILNTECPDVDVLMWNAFPFHPHKKGNLNSNRKPNSEELLVGHSFIDAFMAVFPEVVYYGAVGKVAEKSLEKHHLPTKPIYIRHPSYGGKKKCRENLLSAFKSFGRQ